MTASIANAWGDSQPPKYIVLPLKHKDMDSESQHPQRKLNTKAYACYSGSGAAEAEGFLGLSGYPV